MKINTTRGRLLASTMICGAMAAIATSAAAQDETTGTGTTVQEIVVTGSRIAQPNLTSTSPITVVGSEEVKLQGITRVEDMINQLPQAFADFGAFETNGATGTATVNLRNLGAQRTLVLVDGRRLMPGDPTQNGNETPDLNQIPAALVDRVEVVTGGASAVYGADAVAGVVNFIMKKDFEGVQIDVQHSFFQHNNDNTAIQNLIHTTADNAVRPQEYSTPSGSTRDGFTNDVNIVMGVNTPDGRGNATVYAGYRNVEAVTQAQRDYSACAFASGASFTCRGSLTSAYGTFDVYSADGSENPGTYTLDETGPGNTFRDLTGSDIFNFAPYQYFQRPDERYTFGAFAHYEVNPALDVYSQLMFMDDHSVAQLGPSGVFAVNSNITQGFIEIPCNNPLLSQNQVDRLCGDLGLGPDDTATINLYRRNVEGGARRDNLRHTAYRIVLGAKGDLGNDWTYDVYGLYGTTIYAETYEGEFSLSHVQNALRVAIDPDTGQPACTVAISGSDPSCVPYNPFQIGGVTDAQLAYLQVPGFQSGETVEQVVSGSVSGELGQYGVKSPWASDGVGVAFGAEYRHERSTLRTDFEFSSGDLAGQGSATPPAVGGYQVYELFGEARVPIIMDMPFFQSLTFETGYRFSDYSLGFTTSTWKLAGDWEPVDGLRFRVSKQRAVRAPNVQELFRPQTIQLDGSSDPCAGPVPEATEAQCALTGVSSAQYGNILANPAEQYNGITGGNPNLRPETADTLTFGVVYSPSFLPRSNISLDWYNIKVDDLIGGVGADLAINRCIQTGDAFYCGLVQRAPGTGSLFTGGGAIVDTNLNTGSLEVEGLDVEANYRIDLDDMHLPAYGGLAFNFMGSWLDKYIVQPLPGDPTYDCAGLYGSICGTPIPQWRHKLRVTWSTPWNAQISANWRHLGGVDLDKTSSNPQLTGAVKDTDRSIDKQDYFDLSGTWTVMDKYTLRAGVNNVFDKEPPLVGASALTPVFGDANTFPQVYDPLGRYMFVGLTANF